MGEGGGVYPFFHLSIIFIFLFICFRIDTLRLMLVQRPTRPDDTLSDSSDSDGYCASLQSAATDVGGALCR